ncbi:membrane protein TMS1, partial [Aspergillus sclerotialis]
MLTIAYTTTRAATQGFAMGSNTGKNRYAQLTQDENEHGLVSQQPASRREIMRAAVESGALPASALDEDSDDEDTAE